MPSSHSRLATSDDGASTTSSSAFGSQAKRERGSNNRRVDSAGMPISGSLRKPPVADPTAPAAPAPALLPSPPASVADTSKTSLAKAGVNASRRIKPLEVDETVIDLSAVPLVTGNLSAEVAAQQEAAAAAGWTLWRVVMWGMVTCHWKLVRGLSWLLNRQQYCCRPIAVTIYFFSDRMDKHMPTLRGLWIWIWGTYSLALHFTDVILQYSTIALLYANDHGVYALILLILYIQSHYMMAVIMYMEMDRISGKKYKGGDVFAFIRRMIDVVFWDVQLFASVVHANMMIEGTTQMQLHGYEEARITVHALINTIPACVILGILYGETAVWQDIGSIPDDLLYNFRSQVYVALAISIVNALDKWLRAAFLCDPALHPAEGDGYPLLYMRSDAGRLPYSLIQDFLFRCNMQLLEEEDKMTLRILYDHYHYNNKGSAKELCDGHKAYLLLKAMRTFNGTVKFSRAESIVRRLDKNKFKMTRTIRNLNFESVMPAEKLVTMMAEVLASSHGFDRLSLNKNHLGDARVRQVITALRSNAVVEVHHLTMTHNDIGADGASAIAVFLDTTQHLATLDLSDNLLTDEGVKSIAAALSKNGVLYRLDLTNCGVGPEGAAALGNCLRTNTGLRELILTGTRIGSAGVDAIAKGLRQNSTLRELDVSHTQMDDRAAAALASMMGVNRSISRVNLSNTRIGDAGGKALCDALHQNNNIQVIDVSNTPMDPSWRRLLQNVISGRVK